MTERCPTCGHKVYQRGAGRPKKDDHIEPKPYHLRQDGTEPTELQSERQKTMAAMYASGKTLQEIGDLYSITRERARQIIAKSGLTGAGGGAKIRAAIKNETMRSAKVDRKNAYAKRIFGLDYAVVMQINGGKAPWSKGTISWLFVNQKRNAKRRGIPWEISYSDWLFVWADSGMFDDRGQGRDKYVMARKGDVGPYAIGNVEIITGSQNVKDYQAELKRRGVLCHDGYRRLPEKAYEVKHVRDAPK